MVFDLCNAIVICLGPMVMVEAKFITNFVHFSSCSHKVVCSFVHFSSCSHKVLCSFGERLICNCTCCELVKQNFAVAANVRTAPDNAHHLQKPLSISSNSQLYTHDPRFCLLSDGQKKDYRKGHIRTSKNQNFTTQLWCIPLIQTHNKLNLLIQMFTIRPMTFEIFEVRNCGCSRPCYSGYQKHEEQASTLGVHKHPWIKRLNYPMPFFTSSHCQVPKHFLLSLLTWWKVREPQMSRNISMKMIILLIYITTTFIT